jgi:hypothetical protein
LHRSAGGVDVHRRLDTRSAPRQSRRRWPIAQIWLSELVTICTSIMAMNRPMPIARTPIQSRRPGRGPAALASGRVRATGSAGASPAGSRTATWERASRPRRSVSASVIAEPLRRVVPAPYRPRGQRPRLLEGSPIRVPPDSGVPERLTMTSCGRVIRMPPAEEAADRLPGLRDHSSVDDYGRCRLGHRRLPPPQGNPPSTMPASCARPCDVCSRYAMPEPSILS